MDLLSKTYQISGMNLLVMVSIMALILLMVIYNSLKIRCITRKHQKLIRNFGKTNIEDSLNRFTDRVEETYKKGVEIENHCNEIDQKLLKCIQKIGVVRYNAFENVGSDLSFAISLLDANNDGVVLNGIFSREGSCTYAKPISNGESKYILSAEEMQALDAAKKRTRK